MMTIIDNFPSYAPYLLMGSVSLAVLLLIFWWRTSKIEIVTKFQVKI